MDKLSYALGLGIGQQLSQMGAENISAEDFAQAINVLVADTARMQALALNAQQIFNEQYSVEALAKVRNNIYEQR